MKKQIIDEILENLEVKADELLNEVETRNIPCVDEFGVSVEDGIREMRKDIHAIRELYKSGDL